MARWVAQQAGQHDDATFELVDLPDFPLPHLDELVGWSESFAPLRDRQLAARQASWGDAADG
ncbi:hypothetical protein UK23_09545 [Lentzea aerocolonigenes]|uniref:Uncharacterized protein n=1 Tax=Lentzea aerocolonigenes TaxID=68170 RepID=A0A0F0HAQ3_LENAE|nr:hypothetical protein UK23_09545 [Lentzea aerocolonigenes]